MGFEEDKVFYLKLLLKNVIFCYLIIVNLGDFQKWGILGFILELQNKNLYFNKVVGGFYVF